MIKTCIVSSKTFKASLSKDNETTNVNKSKNSNTVYFTV